LNKLLHEAVETPGIILKYEKR